MLELPEAQTLSIQIKNTMIGKKIKSVVAGFSPHKFVWYYGDPKNYNFLLSGKAIDDAKAYGGFLEVNAGSAVILIGDGVGLRYHESNEKRPKKHQLLIEFEDSTAISASVQMYGGIWCFNEGEFINSYRDIAMKKPSPLTDNFDRSYFNELVSAQGMEKVSAKAFLATEQRIPGLGNGVLQDILWNAKIHPKRKINTLSNEDMELLFTSIKKVLSEMTRLGGRDTEKDLFGNYGGYKTAMSKSNKACICPACGGFIKKEAYMGGSIYYCERCQK